MKHTMIQHRIMKALGLTLISTTALMACDRDEKIDENTAYKTISSNLTGISNTMVKSIEPFEESEAFGVEGDSIRAGSEICSGQFNDSTNTYEEQCETEPAPELDAEMTQARDLLLNALDEYVFRDDQIEDQKRREITYLMKGSNLCKEMIQDATAYNECVTTVDRAEIRLVVTSPEEGDIDVDLFFGQDKRYNPFSMNIWRDRLGLEGDLQDISKSAEFLAEIGGEDIKDQFPDTFEGRFRLELSTSGARSMAVSASVLNAIKIADVKGGYDVLVGTANPAGSLTMDGDTKLITAEANLNTVKLKFPEESYQYVEEYDDQGNSVGDKEVVTSFIYDIAMAGLKGKTSFDVPNEKIIVTGASLGGAPFTFDVDGGRVFSMDLDQAFDATISEPGDDALQIDVSPASLNLNFSFESLMEKMDEFGVDDWMLDEQIQISVSGNGPSFVISEGQVKALAGKLFMKATKRNVEVVVEGNQCLLNDDSDDISPVEPCTGSECGESPGQPDPVDAHPFSSIEAGTCK